jgi:hypothetical protein
MYSNRIAYGISYSYTTTQICVTLEQGKGEGKVVLLLNEALLQKDVWGSEGTAPGIVNLDTK